MLTLRRSLLAVALLGSLLGSTNGARALSFDTLTEPFTGSDSAVRVILDDTGGVITVTVTVTEGLADLRGVFLDIRDGVLFPLSSLQATGEYVTGFETGDVIDLGQGANLNGGGSPCPCDIGVLLGTPGIGKDDIQSTSFVLSLATGDPLDLGMFTDQRVGVRVTSVGLDEKGRDGSSKLVGTLPDTVPVPEPSPALLTAIGLGVLSVAGRRLRS